MNEELKSLLAKLADREREIEQWEQLFEEVCELTVDWGDIPQAKQLEQILRKNRVLN